MCAYVCLNIYISVNLDNYYFSAILAGSFVKYVVINHLKWTEFTTHYLMIYQTI